MNRRMFTVILLTTAFSIFTFANSLGITLSDNDFLSAKKIYRDGEVLVSFKLSKSGKAKFKKLNKESIGKNIHSDIGGVVSSFKLKVPIKGENLEAGPYSNDNADKILSEINND